MRLRADVDRGISGKTGYLKRAFRAAAYLPGLWFKFEKMGNTPDKRNCSQGGCSPETGQHGDHMNRQIYYHKAGKWFSPELFGGGSEKKYKERRSTVPLYRKRPLHGRQPWPTGGLQAAENERGRIPGIRHADAAYPCSESEGNHGNDRTVLSGLCHRSCRCVGR